MLPTHHFWSLNLWIAWKVDVWPWVTLGNKSTKLLIYDIGSTTWPHHLEMLAAKELHMQAKWMLGVAMLGREQKYKIGLSYTAAIDIQGLLWLIVSRV